MKNSWRKPWTRCLTPAIDLGVEREQHARVGAGDLEEGRLVEQVVAGDRRVVAEAPGERGDHGDEVLAQADTVRRLASLKNFAKSSSTAGSSSRVPFSAHTGWVWMLAHRGAPS